MAASIRLSVLLPSIISALLLAACGNSQSPAPASSAVPASNQSDVGNIAPENNDQSPSLNLEDIKSKSYMLIGSLNFGNAEVQRYTQLEGTSHSTEVLRHSFFYANQQQLQRAKAEALTSYCEIFVETNPEFTAQSTIFAGPKKLRVGQIGHQISSRGPFSFSLALQANLLQSLTLECHNTANADAISAHIGNLFNLSN